MNLKGMLETAPVGKNIPFHCLCCGWAELLSPGTRGSKPKLHILHCCWLLVQRPYLGFLIKSHMADCMKCSCSGCGHDHFTMQSGFNFGRDDSGGAALLSQWLKMAYEKITWFDFEHCLIFCIWSHSMEPPGLPVCYFSWLVGSN